MKPTLPEVDVPVVNRLDASRAIQLTSGIQLLGLGILVVGNLLQSRDSLAVEFLLDSDGAHRLLRFDTVPVLLVRGEPDNVAGADLFIRAALTLDEPTTARDHELYWVFPPPATF